MDLFQNVDLYSFSSGKKTNKMNHMNISIHFIVGHTENQFKGNTFVHSLFSSEWAIDQKHQKKRRNIREMKQIQRQYESEPEKK